MIRARTTPSFGFDTVSYQITAGILPWSTLFKAETDVQRIRLIVGTALEVRFPGENCASKVAREDYLTILSRNINRLFRSDPRRGDASDLTRRPGDFESGRRDETCFIARSATAAPARPVSPCCSET